MEAIIAKYDYVHGTEELESKIQDDLNDSDEKFAPGLKLDGIKKIISTFVKKVCVQPFPKRNSPGYYMCTTTLRNIIAVMKACKSEHQTLTKPQCQDLLFDLILDFISKGQGSTHFELIEDVCKVLSMTAYIRELRGSGLKRLLDAVKQQKYVEEKEIEIDEYARSYERAVGSLLEDALGEDDEDDAKGKHREPEIHAEFLDLYIFFLVQITKNPEGMANHLGYCQNKMWYKYNRKPYNGCKNGELYKKHLKIIQGVLADKKFPRFKEENTAAEDAITYVLKGAAEDAVILKLIWSDLTEFFTSIPTTSKAEHLIPIMKEYRYFNDWIAEEIFQKNPVFFEIWAQKFAEMLKKGINKELIETIAPRQIRDMLDKTKPLNGHDKYWIPILKGLLRYPTKDASSEAENLIRCKKMLKIWSWKKNVEEAKQIVITAKEADVPVEEGKGWDNRNILSHYGKVIKELFEQLQLVKVSDKVMPELALFIISALEKRSVAVNKMAEECSDQLDLTNNKDIIPDLLKRFSVLYMDKDYPWSEGWSGRVGSNTLEAIAEAYKDGKDVPEEVNDMLVNILLYAMDDDTERIDFESRSLSLHGQTVITVMLKFVILHCDSGTGDVLAPILPAIFKMMEDDNEDTTNAANTAFTLISVKAPKVVATKDDFERLIQRYLDTGDNDVLGSVYRLYPHNTYVMAKRFQDVMKTLGKGKDTVHMLFALMYSISEKQPEIFTRDNVNAMSPYLDNEQVQHQVLMIWDKVAIKHPDFLLDQVDIIMQKKNLPLTGTHFIQAILSTVAVRHEKYLEPVLKFFIERSKNSDQLTVLPVFYGMRKLADHYGPEPFVPYREYLDELKSKGVSHTNDAASSLIDVLEGRSLENLSTDVKQVKEDVNELDERVTGTEVVVGGVVQQVERHEGEIKDVQVGVANVNKRVDGVEEDIVEVKEKVEEIDMKTMSNAPTWSRDVTKLLNPESDHDWRLLASRLGYTNDDIRAWATQSDPCMALLSEWYATHKTREATSGVLNILQEMNRLDAAVIVENAMKTAEDVVEDEDFEYPSPPPVFLSYQWGHQNEVKLLRQHLQMAGYECWMDIGQMGGGDKLFEKIDAGIRGAKVVICCTSEKYAKSPNCNREVNLAVNLRKPMIPLQMEKLAWPPAGSMGPIFSEYLYIRFYSGGGTDGKYWAEAKFQELLMQLQFNNVVPDEKLITQEYKNWWIPVAEEIVVSKPVDKSGSKAAKTEKKDNSSTAEDKEKSPEVFLSYQWGKQKQIQALYKQLTGLGFHCWMDIHQMGGGDSLYDKIDRGVRGCKVVLSSVTQKYSLSANCRREVSLADALKKPVIPLLLEKIDWPPSGPMSMVFTQLLYIDFSNDPDVQMKWTGKEFDELIKKMKGHLPEIAHDGDVKGKTAVQENTNTESKPKTQDKSNQSNKNLAESKGKNASVEESQPKEEKRSNDPKQDTSQQHQQQQNNTPTKPDDNANQSINNSANQNDSGNKNGNKPSSTKKSSACYIL